MREAVGSKGGAGFKVSDVCRRACWRGGWRWPSGVWRLTVRVGARVRVGAGVGNMPLTCLKRQQQPTWGSSCTVSPGTCQGDGRGSGLGRKVGKGAGERVGVEAEVKRPCAESPVRTLSPIPRSPHIKPNAKPKTNSYLNRNPNLNPYLSPDANPSPDPTPAPTATPACLSGPS